MTDNTTPSGKRRRAIGSNPARNDWAPDWARGLKSLYDSVVDEPLPDDMIRLLASLDAANPDPNGKNGSHK